MLLIVYRYAFLIVLISFLALGFFGGGLLCLPGVLHSHSISFIDSLFISFSAICGVGVSFFSLADFSVFGKIVLMFIMYFGSIGILTFILAIISYFSVYNAEWYGLAREVLNIIHVDKIGLLFKSIFLISTLAHCFGILSYLCLASYLNIELSFMNACFVTLNFFTNVGFPISDFVSPELMNHPWWLGTSILLMLVGGLGFLFFFEMKEYILKKIINQKYRLSLTTKAILYFFFLTVLAMWAFYFFVCESDYSLLSFIRSLFAAISFRACGISPYRDLSETLLLVSALYGILGTAPFGTGGGIKTSLLSIIMKTPITIFQKKDYLILFYKKISWRLVALCHIFLLYIITVSALFTIFIEAYSGKNINFMLTYSDILGLMTSSGTLWQPLLMILGSIEKVCCIILMACGKISGIVLTLYVAKVTKSPKQYPDGNLILL